MHGEIITVCGIQLDCNGGNESTLKNAEKYIAILCLQTFLLPSANGQLQNDFFICNINVNIVRLFRRSRYFALIFIFTCLFKGNHIPSFIIIVSTLNRRISRISQVIPLCLPKFKAILSQKLFIIKL